MSTTDRPSMRPFQALASFAEARRVAAELTPPLERVEEIELLAAAGRVLASPALARVDVPSADRSAMDGYAVNSAELGAPPVTLRRAGRIAAGQEATAELRAGECIEIATGAPLPPGADAVVPVEQTQADDDRITLLAEARPEQHIARRGSDVALGSAVGEADDRVTAALLAACAAAGIDRVEAWQCPAVLVVPTGDEVVPLGEALRAGQVYDSNAAGLASLLAAAGARVQRHPIVVDEAAALRAAMRTPGFDLVITIGGTSVGRKDLVSDCVAEHGEVRLHGVAVRPGKPLLLGRLEDRPIIGLPGFPTTCMMLGYALVAPRVRAMGHLPPTPATMRAPLSEELRSPRGKAHLMPVALVDGAAVPTFTFSSAVSAMARADGWIELADDVAEVAAGSTVDVHLF